MKTIKKYDILDLTKFILSLMVVAIHAGLFPKILYPWLRLAIPLFFIISSFLLYEKIKNDNENKKDIIKKYIIRQLKYYLFWFIILLPITVYLRMEWFDNGILRGLIKTLSCLLFSSSFIASWYITATVSGTVIVYLISKKFNNRIMFIMFIIPFLICCLISSYNYLFDNFVLIKRIYKYYEMVFTSPVFSFPVSLIWILIGKMISDNLDRIISAVKKNRVIVISMLFLSAVLLYIEWRITSFYSGIYSNDCLLFLLPTAVLIFLNIIVIDLKIKHSVLLRKMSIIIYPLHASLLVVISFVIKKIGIFYGNVLSLVIFLLTVLGCLVIFVIITTIETKKYFRWLKYSH